MKNLALALFLCLLAGPICVAQQSSADAPASKEDVERYFEAMHTRDLVKSMMETVKKQVRQTLHAQASRQPNLPPDFEEKESRILDETWRDFPLDEMLEAMIPVYEKHFTKGDMDQLVAFYSGPTGQKVVRELPSVTAESMQASQGIIQKMVAKQMLRMQEDMTHAQQGGAGAHQP